MTDNLSIRNEEGGIESLRAEIQQMTTRTKELRELKEELAQVKEALTAVLSSLFILLECFYLTHTSLSHTHQKKGNEVVELFHSLINAVNTCVGRTVEPQELVTLLKDEISIR